MLGWVMGWARERSRWRLGHEGGNWLFMYVCLLMVCEVVVVLACVFVL